MKKKGLWIVLGIIVAAVGGLAITSFATGMPIIPVQKSQEQIVENTIKGEMNSGTKYFLGTDLTVGTMAERGSYWQAGLNNSFDFERNNLIGKIGQSNSTLPQIIALRTNGELILNGQGELFTDGIEIKALLGSMKMSGTSGYVVKGEWTNNNGAFTLKHFAETDRNIDEYTQTGEYDGNKITIIEPYNETEQLYKFTTYTIMEAKYEYLRAYHPYIVTETSRRETAVKAVVEYNLQRVSADINPLQWLEDFTTFEGATYEKSTVVGLSGSGTRSKVITVKYASEETENWQVWVLSYAVGTRGEEKERMTFPSGEDAVYVKTREYVETVEERKVTIYTYADYYGSRNNGVIYNVDYWQYINARSIEQLPQTTRDEVQEWEEEIYAGVTIPAPTTETIEYKCEYVKEYITATYGSMTLYYYADETTPREQALITQIMVYGGITPQFSFNFTGGWVQIELD